MAQQKVRVSDPARGVTWTSQKNARRMAIRGFAERTKNGIRIIEAHPVYQIGRREEEVRRNPPAPHVPALGKKGDDLFHRAFRGGLVNGK